MSDTIFVNGVEKNVKDLTHEDYKVLAEEYKQKRVILKDAGELPKEKREKKEKSVLFLETEKKAQAFLSDNFTPDTLSELFEETKTDKKPIGNTWIIFRFDSLDYGIAIVSEKAEQEKASEREKKAKEEQAKKESEESEEESEEIDDNVSTETNEN